jgi:hypothetical protein
LNQRRWRRIKLPGPFYRETAMGVLELLVTLIRYLVLALMMVVAIDHLFLAGANTAAAEYFARTTLLHFGLI